MMGGPAISTLTEVLFRYSKSVASDLKHFAKVPTATARPPQPDPTATPTATTSANTTVRLPSFQAPPSHSSHPLDPLDSLGPLRLHVPAWQADGDLVRRRQAAGAKASLAGECEWLARYRVQTPARIVLRRGSNAGGCWCTVHARNLANSLQPAHLSHPCQSCPPAQRPRGLRGGIPDQRESAVTQTKEELSGWRRRGWQRCGSARATSW